MDTESLIRALLAEMRNNDVPPLTRVIISMAAERLTELEKRLAERER